MTKKKRIQILKAMKSAIEKDKCDCLCNALIHVDSSLWNRPDGMELLDITKPKNHKKYSPYWFAKGDKKSRITAINKAIKRLQCK